MRSGVTGETPTNRYGHGLGCVCPLCSQTASPVADLSVRDALNTLREDVLAAITKGYHPGGHHHRCATRSDDGCDCYARGTVAARRSLDTLVARAVAAEEKLAHLESEPT